MRLRTEMLFLTRSRRFREMEPSLRGRPRPVSSWPCGLHGGGPRSWPTSSGFASVMQGL